MEAHGPQLEVSVSTKCAVFTGKTRRFGCNESCRSGHTVPLCWAGRVSLQMSEAQCSWCGVAIEAHEGYRAAEAAGERVAAFCRLEHVVPWAIQGAHWEAGVLGDPPQDDPALERCAHCEEPGDDRRVLLVHHRGEHRIADAFCSVDHAAAWAKAGGRWG
jgi:hypothetical protein